MSVAEVRNICFSYGKKHVLQNLNLSVQNGECLVLAGPNGSGKSTALSIIAGAVKPSSGEVIADGRIGYVPQGNALFEDASVKDNLKFFAGLAGCTVPQKLCFGVERYAAQKVSALSGGMKKQVSIACALLAEPDIILFDEPCDSLDIGYRDEFIELVQGLKSRGKTIIYVGHDPLEFAAFYDKLLFLGSDPPRLFSRAELSGSSEHLEDFCINYKNLFK
ncbi:MAG: ATP-binding cassette domain-containing protein [Firmicutes bacterium]|nr:ATP-binding cassette domain-containing protein [Bacillota bacterium]